MQIIGEADAARNLFGGKEHSPKGRLRVDIPVGLAKPLIIPQLPDFALRYPDIEVILGVSDQPVDLLAEGVDCVLRVGELTSTSVISRIVVARVAMVTCAAPDYLATYRGPEHHRGISRRTGRSPLSWGVAAIGWIGI